MSQFHDDPAHALLDWYAHARRDLPWRHTHDPYRLWVAEVMLVQTTVAAVLPYYDRFLAHFPDLPSLAAAPLDEVLKAWEGLGYYARARHLHRAARQVVAQHGGRLPEDPAALRALPGVGDYMAAALGSMAFGRDELALDANVRRVLARLFLIAGSTPQERADLRRRGEALLPRGCAGDFNQALMDLGAGVCTPRRPRCLACPLVPHCLAHAAGDPEAVPSRPRRRALPHYDVAAAVIRHDDGRLLIAQRPEDGLLGGLWEFPGGKCEPGEALENCARREIREELALDVEVGKHLVSVPHSYTHFSITLHAYLCRPVGGEPCAIGCRAWRWVRPEELDGYAFSAADRKVIAALRRGAP
ncbi:MAG: A/G-specific adenine glycosylase [Anaerolineae bacterium]